MIKNFKNYSPSNNDIFPFIYFLISNNVKTQNILNFKIDLETNINLNESLNIDFKKLKNKYNSWLNDKLFKWLINRKKTFYVNLIEKLDIFNLNTLDDIYKHYPNFKLDSIYLAGGVDDASDSGKGWRNRLEYEFETNKNKIIKHNLPKINLYDEKITPSYVIDSENLKNLLLNKKTLKLYNKPVLLNPVRMEVDRDDNSFDNMFKSLKSNEYDPNKDILPFNWFRKTFSQNIEPNDEHLLRISDLVFLGQDKTAGAGTFGELELLSLMNKPLFAWLVNESTDKISAFKLWNIPHLSKIARNEKEMQILVNTILNSKK